MKSIIVRMVMVDLCELGRTMEGGSDKGLMSVGVLNVRKHTLGEVGLGGVVVSPWGVVGAPWCNIVALRLLTIGEMQVCCLLCHMVVGGRLIYMVDNNNDCLFEIDVNYS